MQGKLFVTSGSNLPYLQSTYSYQGFPVRNIRRPNPDDGGAWLVEFKSEKRREFEALCKRSPPKQTSERPTKEFSGHFIIKHCQVEDPKDLCILNASGKHLIPVDKEEFSLFENVIKIDASDNQLNVDTFRTFPRLEELELQVNSISCLHVHHKDFSALRKLDLSYNNLTHTALLNLGKLRNIQDLSLRGCGLQSLPAELARKYQVSEGDSDVYKRKAETKSRFPSLAYLDLSENELTDISTFASLAGLRKLKCLSLSCNKISGVPHLRLMAAHRHFSMSTCTTGSAARMHRHANGLDVEEDDDDICDAVRHLVSQNTVEKQPFGETVDSDGKDRIAEDEASVEKKETNEPVTETKHETEEETGDEQLMDDIEKTISQINSEKDVNETSDLLNIDFAKELNFGLYDDVVDANGEMLGTKSPQEVDVDALDIPDPIGTPALVDDNLFDEELNQPFPCLKTLDLSYNEIKDQESLLALTGWPLLQDLKLWGNPLMRAYKGIPPVLLHHLNVMCGINIHRKEPCPDRNYVIVPPKSRKPLRNFAKKMHRVKTDLPPIKRNNMLAIENMILQAIEGKSPASNGGSFDSRQTKSENDIRSVDVEESSTPVADGESGENFFLTQQDNEEGIKNEEMIEDLEPHIPSTDNLEEDIDEQESQLLQLEDVQTLLDVGDDDCSDFIVPETIHGSVTALKHMLNNQLVFNAGHYNKKKIPRKQKRNFVKSFEKRKGTLDVALDNIRLNETSYEENLERVLDDFQANSDLREKFPEAKQMMDRVQKKYDHVRLKSLQPMAETQKELENMSTRVDEHAQDLVLSRMKRGKIGDVYSTSRNNTPRIKIRGTRYDQAE